MAQHRVVGYHPHAADYVEKSNPDKSQKQGQISVPGSKSKGGKKQWDHADSAASPGEAIDFYDGKPFGYNFSKGQEKESNVEHRADDTDICRTGPKAEGKKGYNISCQKSPGNSVKNIKNIINIPGLAKPVGRKSNSHFSLFKYNNRKN
jgi:hypothetical protein